MIERLWAGWRSAYVAGEPPDFAPRSEGLGADGADDAGSELTVFQRILASGLPDDETLVVWRGNTTFAILNIYPYTTGHLLVLPYEPRRGLDDLTVDESAELWLGIRLAGDAIGQAYRPDGLNIGMNIEKAAGAGIPDHLHAHVLPRWAGDTNFMTALAETRVMPESLRETWTKLSSAWPNERR